ncbi:hypothetical protein [Ochrobactrum sp. SFR4]|uniref:hypothetical protein n=1 Tax=Ochrobactrum sp. SFR4 TaxID=2717368 RepID=UPI001C8BAF47|nr:hypothetical protein [Ochrobactrum sp. SFR4]MBX8824717.1 hypothetical protein [Ochrobactrum sp. SFR4]
MKLPTQDETEALISLATNHHAMRLLHELPRKIVKLLCAALKREHEMRVARDKKIRGLLNEIERQKDLRRAVPDVPELVRLTLIDHYGGNSEMVPVGSVEAMYPEEYVLHSQAVEIIAAEQQKTKDAEELAFRMDRFARKYLRHLNNEKQDSEQKSKDWFAFCELIGVDIDSHEAVADKVNSLKDDYQVPDFWADAKSFNVFAMHWPKVKVISVSKQRSEKHSMPLYASPAPAADLKADAARYQYLRSRDVETIRKGGVFAGVTPENYVINGVDLDYAIDAALNVEASNDKG